MPTYAFAIYKVTRWNQALQISVKLRPVLKVVAGDVTEAILKKLSHHHINFKAASVILLHCVKVTTWNLNGSREDSSLKLQVPFDFLIVRYYETVRSMNPYEII